jgi:hypothetical protein
MAAAGGQLAEARPWCPPERQGARIAFLAACSAPR